MKKVYRLHNPHSGQCAFGPSNNNELLIGNDSLQPAIYLSDADKYFLTQRLGAVEAALADVRYRAMWGTGTIMTAALLVVLPLLILYAFTQRYFVESIERTGLIG